MLYTSSFPADVPVEEAAVALVGIPWDSTELGRSVRHGPLFLREALRGLEGWDPETRKQALSRFADVGDVQMVPGNWALTGARIADTARWLSREKALPVFLGGDHLITLGILDGLRDQGPFTVVHFDAHADLSKDWQGEPFSHISWGYHAIQQGFPLVQLGVRSCTEDEQAFLDAHPLQRLEDIRGKVYITVDLDVFDPGFAPEVGTPEPLGLSPPEVFRLLKQTCTHEVVGLDIVECAADRVGTATALLGAQIIKKVVAWTR